MRSFARFELLLAGTSAGRVAKECGVDRRTVYGSNLLLQRRTADAEEPR